MNRPIATVGVITMGIVAAAVLAFADRPGETAQHESRAYLHGYNLPSTGLALEGYCPVAYFAVNKPVRGKSEHASTYNGVTYHFVSADAKRTFDAEPRKYIPAFGGWCAFGMAIQDKFPVDPRSFKIVDGQLMLFLKNRDVDALELWNDGNEQELIQKAEAHWTAITQ
jgi:YHS domain-containing protein